MKNILLVIFVFISFQFTTAQSENGFNSLKEKSNALLEECVTYNETVGITAGIYIDGKIEWIGAVGFMDLENKIRINANTLNRTASIAKPMTAIAILQLYELGKLTLDDPIQKHLPYFPKKEEGEITIKHLLTHTSGIGAYESQEEAFPTYNYNSFEEAITIFKDRPLKHSPGSNYSYTTYGYVVLGAIIENASGISYRDYMKQYIWDKAGMAYTDVELYGKQYPNKSKLYYKNPSGEFVPDTVTNLSVKVPGGGFYTSTEDLLKFGEAVIKNKLIKPETFIMMITDPGVKTWSNPYAMGWYIYGDENNNAGHIIGHSGSQSGTSTQLMINLDKEIVVATLGNTSECWNQIYDVTNKLLSTASNPETIKKPLPKVISISAQHQEKLVGNYVGENERVRRITKRDNQLYIYLNNDIRFRLYATSNNNFFIRRADITVNFIKNEKDDNFNLKIIDNGETYTYKKVQE
ncbi:hypothetical protein MTsPCn9_06400 [Croceitalea sp. MTPC9]|uniref:serine hydrolase domain-containing protein n=1 Tax=unclassified Croceitalea TaxID=2632280 RepID=UPI002B3713CD|nr:hypothetical protein MTsPCn6_02310 [Croceitalea sp. MTPC6]GMN15704.1 hypothetical protein MTsPCn9_06400 [Croceitalea sp. MTPC9]